MASHVGRGHTITAPSIADAAGLWPTLRPADRGTRVREIITTWYEAILIPGHVLVSDSSGYYHSSDPDDVAHYHCSLLSRIREIALRTRRVRLAAQTAGLRYHGRGHWSAT